MPVYSLGAWAIDQSSPPDPALRHGCNFLPGVPHLPRLRLHVSPPSVSWPSSFPLPLGVPRQGLSCGYLQRDGVHLTKTAINRVAKNLALKIICAEDGACGQARPPPPPTTRRSDKRDISNHKDDDDIVRRPQPRRPNRVAKNQAQKIICTEDGACGQARPLPPPTTRRSGKRDISNHTYDDDIARRPQSRRSRHADNDENGWQTVRRQPPRRGPTYCHFCGDGGHVKDNCRHGHKLECHSCGQLGHKEKFCAHY